MAYGQNMKAPMAGITGLAALKGRQGDNTLVHVNPMELRALDNMAPGGLTRNPYTGLPEAFKLKDLLPALGAIAGGVFLAPMLGPMLGLGAAGSAAVGTGLGASGGTALAGGNTEEILGSGLMSGATAGLGSYMSGAGQTVGGLEDAAFDKALGAQGITDGGVGASQAQLDLANTAAIKAGDNAVLAGVPSASQVESMGVLEKGLRNVGGLSGAATTGLAAMAPIGPEMPEESEYKGPTQSAVTEMEARPGQTQAVDEFIRKGGAVPQFFDYRVTQPYIAAEGGQLGDAPRGEMFSGMVEGKGDGMSDEVAFDVVGDPEVDTAMLSPDEYVMDAHTVAALGNGSSDAGAAKLDEFRKALREKVYGKQQQPNQINAEKELSKLS
jgi:hypothetical protein